jgi:hypothetical protein
MCYGPTPTWAKRAKLEHSGRPENPEINLADYLLSSQLE